MFKSNSLCFNIFLIRPFSGYNWLRIFALIPIIFLTIVTEGLTANSSVGERSKVDSIRTGLLQVIEKTNVPQNRIVELSVDELLAWDRRGNGYFGNFMDQALQMTEDSHSDGIMLISPDSYIDDVTISYNVMTLRPATVLVTMLSISDGDGSGSITIADDFNGNLADWPDGAVDYFFAFHNAPHFRQPFVIRRGLDGVKLLEEASHNYMKPGQWHHVEVSRSDGSLYLRIDGETILNAKDPNPLNGGHIALRIRGSGTERASCFISNVTIVTPLR